MIIIRCTASQDSMCSKSPVLHRHADFYRTGLWNPGRVYDLFGEMLAALNLFSLLFCVFLNVKVRALKQQHVAQHQCCYLLQNQQEHDETVKS